MHPALSAIHHAARKDVRSAAPEWAETAAAGAAALDAVARSVGRAGGDLALVRAASALAGEASTGKADTWGVITRARNLHHAIADEAVKRGVRIDRPPGKRKRHSGGFLAGGVAAALAAIGGLLGR